MGHAHSGVAEGSDPSSVTRKTSWRRQIERALETVRVCSGQRRVFWAVKKPNPSVLVYQRY